MPYPQLVKYNSKSNYRNHFETVYCSGPIITHDGVPVRFKKADFNHAFFESVNSKDDTFSPLRAERIDWIKAALQDPNSPMYLGWNKKKKCYENNRRVTLAQGNYVVVIAISKRGNGFFSTAFVANSHYTLSKIQQSPAWTP